MNILSIAIACLLVYYLYQGSRPLKRQKGGNTGVVIALVVLLLAGGGVGAYFLLKKGECTDFKCPSGQSLKVSPSPCKDRECKPTECCISDGTHEKGKCTDIQCPSGKSLKVSPSPCQGRTCKPTECCISD